MLAAIWAQDQNGLIGKNNRLPWHLPNDLKFFRKMTEGNTLVMGRKTFEGMGGRPLPNRQTIIMTRQTNYHCEYPQVIIYHDLSDVTTLAKKSDQQIFLAGGATLYQELLPDCDYLYRTVIEASFTGDAYMPEIDWTKWQLVATKTGIVDENNPYPHRFETYERKNCRRKSIT